MKHLIERMKRRLKHWNRKRLEVRRKRKLLSYAQWIARFDTPDESIRSAWARRGADLDKAATAPKLHALIPVDPQTPPSQLQKTLDSIGAQVVSGTALWLIVPEGGLHGTLAAVIEALSRRGIPIDLCPMSPTLATAGPQALELALQRLGENDWHTVLYPGDVMPPQAVLMIREAIQHWPQAELIYADEDRLDAEGFRQHPHFKPDWNPEMLLSTDWLGRAVWMPRRALTRVGGYGASTQPNPHHDLRLRLTETISPAEGRIVHVPHVLLHAAADLVHPEAAPGQSDVAAVQAALNRRGMAAKAVADHHPTGTLVRVVWDPLPAEPSVTIIVPTRNGLSLLQVCLDSVLTLTRYCNYEILVVDNGSDDPATLRYMHDLAARESRVRIHRDDSPFNYSALNNRAAARSNSDVLVLLNNDIEVISPDWLHEMVCWAIQPGIGAVGARLWYSNRTLQHGGVIVGIGGVAGHAQKHLEYRTPGVNSRALILQNFAAVTAACLAVMRKHFDQMDGLDEGLAVAFNDVDFCLKLHTAGLRNIWTPHAELFHHESVSRGSEDTPAKKARFDSEVSIIKSRWTQLIRHDPAYNPNLTIHAEDFGLAVPPRVNLAQRWFEVGPT